MSQEFATGDYIFMLDGRVLEVFRRTSSESMRYHVDFVRIDGKQRGEGYRIRLGAAHGEDSIIGGIRFDLSASEYSQFREFIGFAIHARDDA